MLTQYEMKDLKTALRKAKPDVPLLYHVGELARDREGNETVNVNAKLVAALYDLNLVRLYQKRENGLMHYYLVPLRRLTRTESRTSLSDAERLAQL